VALLGAGMVGTAPSAQAEPEVVRLTFQSSPAAGDPARANIPRWSDGNLNLANGTTYFLGSTAGPYIMDAIFADGSLVYCAEPNVWAPASASLKDPGYITDFRLQGGDYLRDVVFRGDGQALARLLGLVMDNGLKGGSLTAGEMAGWSWDDPGEGQKLAQWVATQLLIWETTVGERNADFSYREPGAGLSPIARVAIRQPGQSSYSPGYQKYSDMIRLEYDKIVAGVQNDLRFPSFVNTDQVFELTWDGSRFVTTLTDPVVSDTDFTTSGWLQSKKDGDSVTFWVEPQALADAADGALPILQATATKTKVPSGVVAWGGSQIDQTVVKDTLPGSPITGTVNFRIAAGSTTVEKILGDHVDDTVTGAGIDYPGSSNWFEYTPVKNLSTDPVQTFDLIAGRDRLKVGKMTVTNNFDGTVTVSYALKQGLIGLTNDGTAHLAVLNNVGELTTVSPGQLPYTVEGDSITVSLDGTTTKKKVPAPAIGNVDDFIVYLHTNAKGVINTGYADYDTAFYVKVTGPSYPDGRVFSFSVNNPDQIHLAPGEYRVVEVANAQGDPLDGYWETSYSAREVTVVPYENVSVTITNKHDNDA
jgi:hypothetical protein